jgi:hypothetical protein
VRPIPPLPFVYSRLCFSVFTSSFPCLHLKFYFYVVPSCYRLVTLNHTVFISFSHTIFISFSNTVFISFSPIFSACSPLSVCRCFTEALIRHVSDEDRGRIERKASKLLQLAVLPSDVSTVRCSRLEWKCRTVQCSAVHFSIA